jgi:hypothetical protein
MAPKAADQAKDVVYDYIWDLARNVSPEQALTAFYDLLCNRIAVGRQDVIASLDRVVGADDFKQEKGLQFLNRSFYTICNPWHLNSEMMPYLNQLIDRLKHLPDPSAHDPYTRLLRRRLHDFSQGDYGDCLHRQMRLGAYGQNSPIKYQAQGVVGDYLPDYFYLYCSTTRTPDIEDLEQAVYDNPLQSGLGYKQSKKLEEMYRAVAQYHRSRLQGEKELFNPTRLPTTEFEQGLINYHPKRPQGFTFQALELDHKISPTTRYDTGRLVVQDYLMASIAALPGQTRDKLYRELVRALGTIDDHASMAGSTVINLFTRLLNAIFLPEFNTSSVLRFQQYVDRAGSTSITGVLLNLLLACPMIRFDLEKKLGYLYRHFEKASLKTEQWVVNFFEHVNLALVMNARHIGYFSVVTQLPSIDSI